MPRKLLTMVAILDILIPLFMARLLLKLSAEKDIQGKFMEDETFSKVLVYFVFENLKKNLNLIYMYTV